MNGQPNPSFIDLTPPAWAEALLPFLLEPANRDAVAGDLLEEYRSTIRPARGRWGADVWYVTTVAGFLWRASYVWGCLLGAAIALRCLFDALLPPADWGPRSSFSTWSAVAIYLCASSWSGRRTGQARTGILVALAAHAVGHAIGIAAAIGVFVRLVQPDPQRLETFLLTGGFGEVFSIPVMLLPIVILLGAIGGSMGKSLGGFSPRSARLPPTG